MTSDVIIVTGGRILFVIRKLLEDAGLVLTRLQD